MSNTRSIEELAAVYSKQSVGEFMNTAMSIPIEDKPINRGEYINNGCAWPCCNEQGECKPMCFVCVAVIIAGGCVCCCYLTNGFNGAWTYWPF